MHLIATRDTNAILLPSVALLPTIRIRTDNEIIESERKYPDHNKLARYDGNARGRLPVARRPRLRRTGRQKTGHPAARRRPLGGLPHPRGRLHVLGIRKGTQKPNIITVAWTGTVCTNPPMVYISVRPQRYSYDILDETGEFVINLTTKELARATDYCGVRSGRDVDKFKETGLTAVEATKVKAPLIAEAPVNIECRITEKKELGSHHMFLAEVLAVHVDEKYLDENGKFQLNKSGLIAYSHGEYLAVEQLAHLCKEYQSRFIHLSTDFVFDGKINERTGQLYTEEILPAPVNYYGFTKWKGEEKVADICSNYAIARVEIVYGKALPGQHGNIVQLVMNRLKAGQEIRVVSDQWRTPTFVGDLSDGIRRLIENTTNGIFHICGDECLTIAEIAYQVADYMKLNRTLIYPVTTEEMQESTPRPRFSGMSIEKARTILGYNPRKLKEVLLDWNSI